MSIIEDSPHLFSIAKDALMDRVYPNLQKSDHGPSEAKGTDLGDLKLPWDEKHWNIFVTSVSSTVDIWGRLIGPDYSVRDYILILKSKQKFDFNGSPRFFFAGQTGFDFG